MRCFYTKSNPSPQKGLKYFNNWYDSWITKKTTMLRNCKHFTGELSTN